MTIIYKHQFAFNELTELLRINKKIVREKIHGAVYGLIHLLINIFPHACMYTQGGVLTCSTFSAEFELP